MPKGIYGNRKPTGISPSNLSRLERKAYEIWCNQRLRRGVRYTAQDFILWYVKEYQKKKWKRAHVGRKDHSKPYSFGNIEMCEQAENNRERNERRGNPGRAHKPVNAHTLSGELLACFPSKTAAAEFYGCDIRTVYNHCTGRTKDPFRFGQSHPTPVRFSWKK